MAATEFTTIKLFSYPLAVAVAAYFNLSSEQMHILAVLLFLDVATGIVRELVIDPRGFSSKIGIVGMLSKLLTFSIPFVVALVGKGVGMDMADFISVAISTLIVYEGWSVISNIGQIRAKDKTIAEYDAISFLIKKIQDFFKKILNVLMG